MCLEYDKKSINLWSLSLKGTVIAHLAILAQYKTKGADGAVYALLRKWQLGA